MNNKQKVTLAGFIIGLIMIFSWNVYDNKFIVLAGFVISLICSVIYSILEFLPDKKITKGGTKKG